jgi:hypothetical protein
MSEEEVERRYCDKCTWNCANTVKCCMCDKYTLCFKCLDEHVKQKGGRVVYSCVHDGDLYTTCPKCKAGNGFAYWTIIERNAGEAPEELFKNCFQGLKGKGKN